jgi:short-subunit dehydrogenase
MRPMTGTPAIVITGASSGIGREIARVACKDGQPLVLVGRSGTELGRLSIELGSGGVRVLFLPLDLQNADAVDRIEAALLAEGLYCDVLVNSAGFGIFGAAAEADGADQLRLVDVNIKATLGLTLRFLPDMIARRRGGIINVGSITGYAPGPYVAAYAASKAFIRSWSAALSAEVAGTGVTVTCLSPGIVRTGFFERKAMGSSRLMKILPRGKVEDVATSAWSAFRKGQALVVPRFIDRLIIRICWLLPDRFLAWMVGALQQIR